MCVNAGLKGNKKPPSSRFIGMRCPHLYWPREQSQCNLLEADVGRVETINSQQSKSICRQCMSRDSLHTGAILGNADFWQSRQPSLVGERDGSPQGSWVPVATEKLAPAQIPWIQAPWGPSLVQKLWLDYSFNWDDLVFSHQKCTPFHVNIPSVGIITTSLSHSRQDPPREKPRFAF